MELISRFTSGFVPVSSTFLSLEGVCMHEGREIRKEMPKPVWVGAFREAAGGELSLTAPALCPLWGKEILNPAAAPARAGHGLCTLLAKIPSCPCWSGSSPRVALPAAPGWMVNQNLQKKPQSKADGKVLEHGEHQAAPASHCYQDLITPLVKPVITLRGQLVLMA